MTQQEIEILHAIVTAESWKLVEHVIEKHVQKLTSVDEMDLTKESDQVMLEVMARKLAKQTLTEILADLSGYGAQEKTNPMNRSFK